MPRVPLDDHRLRRLLPDAPDLTASEVETIGQLAFLTAEIDFDEEPEESSLLDTLNRSLWQMIDEAPKPIAPISPLPLDREERIDWLRKLVPRLTTTHARELAYVAAYLVVVIDLELAPIEGALLRELQHGLGIDDERASELSLAASRRLTPLDDELGPDEGDEARL